MPPFIPVKRSISSYIPADTNAVSDHRAKKRKVEHLLDQPNRSAVTDNKAFLDSLESSDGDSLSSADSEDFEDALKTPQSGRGVPDGAYDEDEEIPWEEALESSVAASQKRTEGDGALELTLSTTSRSYTSAETLNPQKGPSKIARQIRISTHRMHVQFLLFHNFTRNGWLGDSGVQRILLSQLPTQISKEVDRFKRSSGYKDTSQTKSPPDALASARSGCKGNANSAKNVNRQRDWGPPATAQGDKATDDNQQDPVLRLLKILAAYWRKRFTITAPSLRKHGYKSLIDIEEDLAAFKVNPNNATLHGERIQNIEAFRDNARKCEGSRDIGSQLFVALLRSLDLDVRLVASLQPIGFGWNSREQAHPVKTSRTPTIGSNTAISQSDSSDVAGQVRNVRTQQLQDSQIAKTKRKERFAAAGSERCTTSTTNCVDLSILSDDDDFSSRQTSGTESVIDITPVLPKRRANAKYDRDMPAPTYWTEVISSNTNHVYPVDPFINRPAVATCDEHLTQFEPKGARADKAKQVFAYVVAYSSDGTAKEVTTRYLKRHMWPGRTKGARLPNEKVSLLDSRGKNLASYEYDWFSAVIAGYGKASSHRTTVDHFEDCNDLKAVKPERKEVRVTEGTLDAYKKSSEFVLERFLRREEALRPGSKSVRNFTSGKGENSREEPVYLRSDVEICRTAESWHKEGRAVKSGQVPMKQVPVRAVTMNRKREVEEAERDGGGKLMQGMYARSQTDWIIPPPIKDGIIPKNAFGNMDCYVPSMVPEGAVHVPLRSTVRICKRLGIDYAEAVTGFEFGKRMAVPVITGVVIAVGHEQAVIQEWEKDEKERQIKEDGRREKSNLALWRKWLISLRVIERVREEYGHEHEAQVKEISNPFTNPKLKKDSRQELPEERCCMNTIDGNVTEDEKPQKNIHNADDSGGGFIIGYAGDIPKVVEGKYVSKRNQKLTPTDDCISSSAIEMNGTTRRVSSRRNPKPALKREAFTEQDCAPQNGSPRDKNVDHHSSHEAVSTVSIEKATAYDETSPPAVNHHNELYDREMRKASIVKNEDETVFSKQEQFENPRSKTRARRKH